mmetsp:Transcript_68641/g.162824  ORF Transcript_68641/g.162824 Transcript_68641/m.162824 type:complete len:333 (-) Transcript_68641:527-1525(-)
MLRCRCEAELAPPRRLPLPIAFFVLGDVGGVVWSGCLLKSLSEVEGEGATRLRGETGVDVAPLLRAAKTMQRLPSSSSSAWVRAAITSKSLCAGCNAPWWPRSIAWVIPTALFPMASRSTFTARVFACLRRRSATEASERSSVCGSYSTAIGRCLARTTKGAGVWSRCAEMYSPTALASSLLTTKTRILRSIVRPSDTSTFVFCSFGTFRMIWLSRSWTLMGVSRAMFPSAIAVTNRLTGKCAAGRPSPHPPSSSIIPGVEGADVSGDMDPECAAGMLSCAPQRELPGVDAGDLVGPRPGEPGAEDPPRGVPGALRGARSSLAGLLLDGRTM